jgi:hypothetical protein
MEISERTEEWLKRAGYKYYSFISYPKIHDDIGRFAVCVKKEIERQLAATVSKPAVFVDDVDITPGKPWKGKLSCDLCSSVAMVALCVSAYYRSAHKWCGVEWAAMDSLGTHRLRGHLLRPIIPIMLKLEKPIPNVVLATQYVEMTAASLIWERYAATQGFKRDIKKVVDYIGEVAEAIASNQAMARRCDKFAFPAKSAFLKWKAKPQEFPLHVQK